MNISGLFYTNLQLSFISSKWEKSKIEYSQILDSSLNNSIIDLDPSVTHSSYGSISIKEKEEFESCFKEERLDFKLD